MTSLVVNARQVAAVLLLLLAAFGYGRAVLRWARLTKDGWGGVCLTLLAGLAILTGISGWLCLGWAFHRPVGLAVLAVGWALSIPALRRLPRSRPEWSHALRGPAIVTGAGLALLVLGAVLGVRAYANEFSWADDWRYHLTLPRRILVDAGYRYDSFMAEANCNYGGAHGLHVFGLLLGDEITYQMLSPAVAVLLLGCVVFRILQPRYGVAAALGGIAAMLGCSFFWRMGFITLSPDVLMAAMFAGVLWLLLDGASRRRQVSLGGVCGLLLGALIAMKTVNVFFVPHVVAGYVLCNWARGTLRWRRCAYFGIGALLGAAACLLPWVWIEWRNTGSPLYPFVGDQRHVFAWLLARDMVLLDAPMGTLAWMWGQFRAQYLEVGGGLLWIYALILPGLLFGGWAARTRWLQVSQNARVLPLLVMIPATALFSAYLLYSRGTALNTHTRYLLPLMLPCIALVVAWSFNRYASRRVHLRRPARIAIDVAVVVLLAANVWGSRESLVLRVFQPTVRAVRSLAWGDVSERFWRARAGEPAYRGFHDAVPVGSKVLTFVQKTALIDSSRYRVNSITKTMTGVVDVHRLSDPKALLAALRAEDFEYVFVTLEWLEGEKWARERNSCKLSDWSATARTLANLVALQDLAGVETVRSYPDALILRCAPPADSVTSPVNERDKFADYSDSGGGRVPDNDGLPAGVLQDAEETP